MSSNNLQADENSSSHENLNNDSLLSYLSSLRERNTELLAQASFPLRKDESWRKLKLQEWNIEEYNLSNLNDENSSAKIQIEKDEIEIKKEQENDFIDSVNLNSELNLPDDFFYSKTNYISENSKSLKGELINTDEVFIGTLSEYISLLEQDSVENKFAKKFKSIDYIKKVLNAISQENANIFDLQQWANLSTVVLLLIPKNSVIRKPIYIKNHSNSKSLYSNLLILAGENSKVSVIEENSCTSSYVNTRTHIELESSATLLYVSSNRLQADRFAYQRLTQNLYRDSNLTLLHFHNGTKLSKTFITTNLLEEGAYADISGALVSAGQEKNDVEVRLYHPASRTGSNLLFKNGLTGKAHCIFTGILEIPHSAIAVEAHQLNQNILFSDTARVESMPKLEVEPDNVQCTHGTGTGSIDENKVFYLKSRGLSSKDAERLLTAGFFAEILDKLKSPEIKDILAGVLFQKLGLEESVG